MLSTLTWHIIITLLPREFNHLEVKACCIQIHQPINQLVFTSFPCYLSLTMSPTLCCPLSLWLTHTPSKHQSFLFNPHPLVAFSMILATSPQPCARLCRQLMLISMIILSLFFKRISLEAGGLCSESNHVNWRLWAKPIRGWRTLAASNLYSPAGPYLGHSSALRYLTGPWLLPSPSAHSFLFLSLSLYLFLFVSFSALLHNESHFPKGEQLHLLNYILYI